MYQMELARELQCVAQMCHCGFLLLQAVDFAINSVWESRNQGKLFKHMTFPESE
jgi:hypothetical protein